MAYTRRPPMAEDTQNQDNVLPMNPPAQDPNKPQSQSLDPVDLFAKACRDYLEHLVRVGMDKAETYVKQYLQRLK